MEPQRTPAQCYACPVSGITNCRAGCTRECRAVAMLAEGLVDYVPGEDLTRKWSNHTWYARGGDRLELLRGENGLRSSPFGIVGSPDKSVAEPSYHELRRKPPGGRHRRN